jgi:hypothetical protein
MKYPIDDGIESGMKTSSPTWFFEKVQVGDNVKLDSFYPFTKYFADGYGGFMNRRGRHSLNLQGAHI